MLRLLKPLSLPPKATRAPSGDQTGLVFCPENVNLVGTPRDTSISHTSKAPVSSLESTAIRLPLGEKPTLPYTADGPRVPRDLPSRSNHTRLNPAIGKL